MVLTVQVPLTASTEVFEHQYTLAMLILAYSAPIIGRLCEERDRGKMKSSMLESYSVE